MNLSYTNLNIPFKFNNVSEILADFWVNEVLKSNSSKVWLTVIVKNNTKKSYILINNLPFNTSDYPDLAIVLKQVFKAKYLSNRIDYLNYMGIKVHYEKKTNQFFNKLLTFLSIILTFLCSLLFFYFFLSILETFSFTTTEALNNSTTISDYDSIPNEKFISFSTEKNNRGLIFKPFINVFNKSSTNIIYFPSHFLPTKIVSTQKDFNMLEYLLYEQYGILAIYVDILKDYSVTMSNILEV